MASRLEKQFDNIFHEAREKALQLLINRGKEVIPERWKVVLAVGWGCAIIDVDGNTVENNEFMMKRHKKLHKFYEDCEKFEEMFMVSNEVLTNEGLGQWTKKPF